PPPAPKTEAAPEAEAAAVRPLHFAPGSGWEGQQFLQADKKGRLFLLSGRTLEVFRVTQEGGLEPVMHLAEGAAATPGRLPSVWQAAMSPRGDWIVQDGFQPRVFRDGDEESLAEPT